MTPIAELIAQGATNLWAFIPLELSNYPCLSHLFAM